MASPAFPNALPVPRLSSGSRSTNVSGPKLRDSCHACAVSKVKCHKEKPACSRCVKRGLTCWYVASKRFSRKQESISGLSEKRKSSLEETPPSKDTATSPLDGGFSMDLTMNETSYLPSPSNAYALPTNATETTSALFPGVPSPVEISLPSDIGDFTTDLDGFFGSPISFSVQSTSDTGVPGQAEFFTPALHGGSSSISSISDADGNSNTALLLEQIAAFEDNTSEFLANDLFQPGSSDTIIVSSHEAENRQSFNVNDTDCSCLIRAWGLMELLSPKRLATCTMTATQIGEDGIDSPEFKTIIANNEKTVEAIDSMLHCSCMRDRYLLVTLTILVFKVLDRYTAAARNTSDAETITVGDGDGICSRDTRFGSYRIGGEDSARMVGQLVFSKLHRVQGLVNKLSTLLKEHAVPGKSDTAVVPQHRWSGAVGQGDAGSPFSTVLSEQMVTDLRKRLQAVSSGIMQRLQE